MVIREKDLPYYSDELYHYGVKGMKWGVRRYETSGGSYTRAGVKRFNKSKDHYNKLVENKKTNGSNKQLKRDIKNAKRQMKKDYKHLRYDKLADQGKDLYSRGYRITDNMGRKLVSAGATTATITGYLYAGKLINKKQATTLATISGATGLIGTGMGYINYNKDRKLRAYYGHTSNY